MKTLHFVVLLVGLFIAALIFIHMKRGVDAMDRMELSLALNWTFTAVGGALAAISAFLILNRAIAGTTLEQILPLVIAFAGGTSLVSKSLGHRSGAGGDLDRLVAESVFAAP